MCDEELTARESAIASLCALLLKCDENVKVSVNVQYVPLSMIVESDEIQIISPGPGAFLTAKRDLGSNVKMTLFVNGG